MIKSMSTVFFSALLAVSLSAAAHTEEYFDSHAAPHGGQMRMAGPFHLELVTKEQEIVVYVTDHADSKISTQGAVAKATVQTGKDKPKTTIKLESAGDNILKGTGDFIVTPETVFVVFVKLPKYEAESARFTPLKKSDPKSSEGDPQDGHNHHHMHSHEEKPAEDHVHGHHH